MKAGAVLWSVALMIAAIGGLSGCGSHSSHKSSSHKPTVHRVRLTEDDIPDVMRPGVWTGIKGAYRSGNRVKIYTTWSDTSEHRRWAEGASMAAAGDLGYVVCAIVYGDSGEILHSECP